MVKVSSLLLIAFLVISSNQAGAAQYGMPSPYQQNPNGMMDGTYDDNGEFGIDTMDYPPQHPANNYQSNQQGYSASPTDNAYRYQNNQPTYQAMPAPQPAATSNSLSSNKQQQKLKGMEYINHLQNSLLEGNKEAVCGESGICRKNFGEGCKSSKNFLSVCATICSDNNEFRGSYCINSGAKRYRMNAQTFIYNARPEKQKPAESVVQHVTVQLREGRKALRDDKRLFFNTFCTQSAIQMVPGSDRPTIARACLDFLYNGNPPATAIQKLENENILQTPAMDYALAPSGEQLGENQSQLDLGNGMDTSDQLSGQDDIQQQAPPTGGLSEEPGPDQGAVYTGPGTPIIEDKESPVTQKRTKGKKVKAGVKGSKKVAQAPAPQNASQEPASAETDDNLIADQSQNSNTEVQPDQAEQNAQLQDQGGQTDDANNQQQEQNQQDNNQEQAQDKPEKKEKGLLDELGGKGGLKGLLKKFTKKGGGDENGDQSGGDEAAGGESGGNDKLGGIGKLLKF